MSNDPTGKLSHQKIVDGFPEKYQNVLLELLETNGSTADLLKLRILELPNSERNPFMSFIENFVDDEVHKTYYKAKYKNPRSAIELGKNSSESHFDYVHRYFHERQKVYSYLEDKEIDLLSYKSPKIKEQIEDPYSPFDIAEHFYPFEFPHTDSWIKVKEEEFAMLPQILNNFSFSEGNLALKVITNSDGLKSYSFPKYLIEKQLGVVYSNSDRINVNLSLEEFISYNREVFHYIQQCLNPEGFRAFLFNSFAFNGNETNLNFLNIQLKNGVSRGLFRHYLFQLYENLGIEKPKIGFLQLICFKHSRKTLFEKVKDLDNPDDKRSAFEKHYQNIAKNTVSLILAEQEKAEKKANIYPFRS